MRVTIVIPAVMCLLTATLGFMVTGSEVFAPSAVRQPSLAAVMSDVAAVAKNPHPVGTSAHAQVQRYIISELEHLGLRPVVQRETITNERNGSVAYLENIVCKIGGPGSGRAILLVAHYDSAPTSPGAGDNAVGVAALLHVARERAIPNPLGHSLYLLFTDGEELGLMGAKAFIMNNVLAKEVGFVINFDARGTSGQPILYETSGDPSWIISAVSRSRARVFANSVAADVYSHMSNSSDFTVFKQAGYAGVNLAFIRGADLYHTARDKPENLSPSTAGQEALVAVALAREFGNTIPPGNLPADIVYFDILGRTLIHYSLRISTGINLLVVILLAGLLVRMKMKSALRLVPTATCLSVIVLSVLCSIGLGFCFTTLTGISRVHSAEFDALAAREADVFAVCMASISAVGVFWPSLRVINKARENELLISVLASWGILSALLAAYLPSGSYLAVYPLLLAVLGEWGSLLFGRSAYLRHCAAIVVALSGSLIVFPLMANIVTALGTKSTIVLAPVLVMWLYLCCVYGWSAKQWHGRASLLGLAVAVVVFVGREVWLFHDPGRARFDSLFYGADVNTGAAVWASYDREVDAWTTQYLNANARTALVQFFPENSTMLMSAAAPTRNSRPGSLVVDQFVSHANSSTVSLHIIPAPQTSSMRVYLAAISDKVAASIDGKAIQMRTPAGALDFEIYGPPADGISLRLDGLSQQSFDIIVDDIAPTVQFALERPPNYFPSPYRYSNCTIICKHYVVRAPR